MPSSSGLRGCAGGSPAGSQGVSVGPELWLGGAPVGSLGLICPASWSDGLPAGPHGHCASTVPALSCPSGLLSSSSPPQSGGVTSETLASFCHMRQEVPPLVLSAFCVFRSPGFSRGCCFCVTGILCHMRFWIPPLVLRSFGWLRRRWLCVSVSWVAFRHLLPLLVLALGSQSFAQRPSFLEHFVYFVRVFHNVGSRRCLSTMRTKRSACSPTPCRSPRRWRYPS